MKSIYVIYSRQAFLLEEAVKRLKDKMAKAAPFDYYDFNFEVQPEEVINTAQMLSLSLSKKIIVYNGIEKLTKKAQQLFLSYIKKPNDLTVMVLTSAKKDFRNSLINYAVKNKFFYEYKVPKGTLLIDWIKKRSSLHGSKISRSAVEKLLERTGDDLRLLDNEIKKLSIYTKGAEITEADVENVVVTTKEQTVFNLVDAIGEKDAASALSILNELLLDGEQPLKIFGMINRQFKLIFQVKMLADKGLSNRQVADEMKIKDFVVFKCLEQSRNFDASSLKTIFLLLSDADYRLKSGKRQSLVIERMIAESVRI